MSRSYDLLVETAQQCGYTPVCVAYNPYQTVFEPDPPLNEYEIGVQHQSPEMLTQGISMLTYGPQYVTHGHILVNGQRVNLPAYRVKVDDIVLVKEKSRRLACFADALAATSGSLPYLKVSRDDLSAQLLYLPPRHEVPVICEVSLVIEYYSR